MSAVLSVVWKSILFLLTGYRVKAAILHLHDEDSSVSMTSGHYVTALCQNGQWHLANDEFVRNVQMKECPVVPCGVLFERCDDQCSGKTMLFEGMVCQQHSWFECLCKAAPALPGAAHATEAAASVDGTQPVLTGAVPTHAASSQDVPEASRSKRKAADASQGNCLLKYFKPVGSIEQQKEAVNAQGKQDCTGRKEDLSNREQDCSNTDQDREQDCSTREQDRSTREQDSEQDRSTREQDRSTREQDRSTREQDRSTREQDRSTREQDRSTKGSKTAPPGGKTAPPGSKTAPPGSKTAPPGSKTAPPGSKTAPPRSKTAPPGSKTAPPGSKTAPPGSKTAPPGSKTAPDVA